MKRAKSRRNSLKRKSSPQGMQQRLELRIANQPPDTNKYHFIKPGSLNPRKH